MPNPGNPPSQHTPSAPVGSPDTALESAIQGDACTGALLQRRLERDGHITGINKCKQVLQPRGSATDALARRGDETEDTTLRVRRPCEGRTA